MDFSFTDEQQMIRDTAAAFLAEVSDSGAVRQSMGTDAGFDTALWDRITEEMCWHAVHVPEAHGGLGLGYVELAALLEEMGKTLTCAPYFSTVSFGVNALLVAGTEAQKESYLEQISANGRTATLAYRGTGRDWSPQSIDVAYRMNDRGATLDGTCRYVIDGHTAEMLVVAAREENSADESGVALFLVDGKSAGLTRRRLPTLDQTRRQAEVVLSGCRVDAADVMRDPGDAWHLLSRILDLARIAIAAEQTGVATQVLDMTVDYIKERKQFGRPVGSFQAIKHKAADMMLKAEAARSAAYYAACVADEFLAGTADDHVLAEAASVAKAYCSDACFFNAGSALQMHGGIGFTWEHDLHLYFKRAKSLQLMLGDAAYHRERVSRQLLGGAA